MMGYFKPEKLLACLYVFLIGIIHPICAQELYFKNLTIEDGLSQNDVNSIVRDSYGFVWIGTYDGLNRFDGKNLVTFRRQTSNPASLPDNRISSLFEDNHKKLWIGTEAGLISYYSLLKDQFFRVKSPKNAGIIFDFLLTDDGVLYAVSSKGILRLNESSEPEFEFITGFQNYHFRDVLQLPDGDIYFAGNYGIFLLKDDKLLKLPNPEKRTFTSLVYTGSSILVGGYDGLFIIDKMDGLKKLLTSEMPELSISSMTKDQVGNIWIGTRNNGLLQLDSSLNFVNQFTSSRTNPRGLLSNTILKLYYDRFNNLWVGNRHGLCFTNLHHTGFYAINLDNYNGPNVRSILVNDDHLILGINNEGLFKYDLKTNNLKLLKGPRMSYVNHIAKIDNTVYVCSNMGLDVLQDDETLVPVLKNQTGLTNIRCIEKDPYGRLLIGTIDGILIKENNEVKWIWEDFPSLQSLNQSYIFRMLFDTHSNQLLVGTISKGLIVLKMGTNGQFTHANVESLIDLNGDPILNTSVWCFYEAKDNTIWAGTDVGLFRKTINSEWFEQINVGGVIDKKIMGIAEDSNHNLWLSNTHGLIHYNPMQSKVKTYTYDDGLLSSSMTESSGFYGDYLFFGTTNGINYFDPLKISLNPYNPELLLSNIKINNEIVKPGAELFGSVILNENINSTNRLTLNHLQNDVSFEFSGTNFTNNSRNNFRYRLNGYDDRWVYTSNNPIVSYSNLDPGNYMFQLQLEDHEGQWTKNGIELPISIIPSPWKSNFAYVIYAILISLIISGFIYFWFHKQRLDHQIELDKIKIQQDKELREKQLRFFVDVGHEFKTPLSLILAPFNDLMNQSLSREQKMMCEEIVSRNIQRMKFLVNQLLDFGKISEGENLVRVTKKDLRQAIRDYTKAFQWQVLREEIDLRLNLDKCEGYFDRSVLEKGFYNILSNAFKYTPTGGVIDISLKVEEVKGLQYAIITVSDSGPGVPDEQKEHIFERFYHGKDRASSGIGLHLAKSLIQAHGGSITVEDSELNGTKFKIRLPISSRYYFEKEADQNVEDLIQTEHQQDGVFDDEAIEKGETILIVEDDHDLRNYLKISLQNDYAILEANNGEQGLFLAQENLPDMVITDIMMPLMDGIDMCQKLKSNKETSHIPVIFLTAKTDIEFQKKGLAAGAWDFITKPFNSEVLRRKVDNILETRNKFKTYLMDHNINVDIKSHYTSYDQKLIKNINQVIERNINNPNFTVNDLASDVGLSRMHLHRKLKTLVGETGKSIITRIKMKYAIDMFDNGCDRVQEAMNAVGITNYGIFNSNFKKIKRVTATEYIANLKEKSNSI
ncbi:two-component regulator propeller domain-containing protein [Aestuariivivens sediminis]|uniref:hybrid sensor histidine kinase/response regulator transcription factor n=1 Tax=Aestuariivivens sediminis TaxID=2913557 RepID=UPI001F5A00AD|nr:two-component regulator propeller domain-containing protein [Aestuariivivens sediminis]